MRGLMNPTGRIFQLRQLYAVARVSHVNSTLWLEFHTSTLRCGSSFTPVYNGNCSGSIPPKNANFLNKRVSFFWKPLQANMNNKIKNKKLLKQGQTVHRSKWTKRQTEKINYIKTNKYTDRKTDRQEKRSLKYERQLISNLRRRPLS